MKKLRYFALAACALFLTSCDDEDGFYNEKYVDIPNLVQIEQQDVYEAGDYLYVSADFSRFQNEPGFNTPLDLYRTTSGAAGFVFTYRFEKQNPDGQWVPVSTTTAGMLPVDGTVQASDFVLATATYNATDESYEFRAGFPLSQTGNYRLSFGVNSDSTNEIELRSRTQGNNLFLNIISDTNQLNGQGFYTFTVN